MKKQIQHFSRLQSVPGKIQFRLLRHLFIYLHVLIITFTAQQLQAQYDFAVQHIDPAGTFLRTDNMALVRFTPSNAYPNNEGYVTFRAVNPTSAVEDLLITLVDEYGVTVTTKRYHLTNKDHMVPKAAAYNSATLQYFVVGNCDDLFNGGTHDAWYLILDEDLNYVHLGGFNLVSSFGAISSATTNSTVVMDVCASANSGTEFAFVGTILESGDDPTPTGTGATNRRMFLSTLDVSNFNMNSVDYECKIGTHFIDRYTLPARIIEMPDGTDPGFFVCGTGVRHFNINNAYDNAKGFFYFRTDYSLTPLDFKTIDNQTSGDFFSASNLYYEPQAQEIFVAGTLLQSGGNSFFFDKLHTFLNTPTFQPYSTTTWSNKVGLKTLPATSLAGTPKVGHICAVTTIGSVVGGRVYGTPSGATVPVLLDCDYDNADLNNWTSNQNNNIEYYPRSLDNVSAVQYYTGHNINEIWYPSHASVEAYLSGAPCGSCGLGGLCNTNVPNAIAVLNSTVSYYNNTCAHSSTSVTLSTLAIGQLPTVSVTDGAPTQSTNTLSYTNPTISLNDNLCSVSAFKTQTEIHDELSELKYSIVDKGNEFTILCNNGDKAYKVLNLQGALLCKGEIYNSRFVFDSSNFINGIYLIEIFGASDKGVKTIKFVKH